MSVKGKTKYWKIPMLLEVLEVGRRNPTSPQLPIYLAQARNTIKPNKLCTFGIPLVHLCYCSKSENTFHYIEG